MSFSIEFYARSKQAALAKLKTAHAPASVLRFLTDAVENLAPASEDQPRAIKVKAVGHLCDGPSSYAVSSAQIDVYPIPLD